MLHCACPCPRQQRPHHRRRFARLAWMLSAGLPAGHPTMLFTKPLTTFLNANRTPQLHTLILITPNGKLLSSSSALSASILRSQATVASAIFALYPPLPSSGTSSSQKDEQLPPNPPAARDPNLNSILIQLDLGTMIIRPLKCALLFVTIGPAGSSSAKAKASSASLHRLGQDLEHLNAPVSPLSRARSPAGHSDRDHADRDKDNCYRTQLPEGNIHESPGVGSASVPNSDTASLMSLGPGSLRLLRRQAEELARWLDEQLEGFVLAPGV